jgi:multisubunit Na+/H+ antiporter MnhC subunit
MENSAPHTSVKASLSVIVLLVGAFNLFTLNAAYGDGPPYYSRTANMDKWVDPLPTLAVIDAIGALAVGAIVYLTRRKR